MADQARGTTTDQIQAHLLDQAQTALVAMDLEGNITHWNRYAEILYGLASIEALGKPGRNLLSPPSRLAEYDKAFKIAAAGGTWEGDQRAFRQQQQSLYVHSTYSPLTDDTGEVIGVLCVSFDITQRIRSERARVLSHEVTQTLSESDHVFEATPQILKAICTNFNWEFGGLWQVDKHGNELRCVDVWHQSGNRLSEFEEATRWMTLKKGEGLPGRVWDARAPRWIADLSVDVNIPRRSAADKVGFHAGVGFPILLRAEVLGVMEFFSPEIREPEEELIESMMAIGSQIGQFMERKQAEEQQRLTEARKTAIVESALDSIIIMDHLGYIQEFNPAAEQTFGYTREEAIGKEMAGMIIPDRLQDAHRKGLLNYLETGDGPVIGNRIEIVAVRSNGEEFPIELAVQRVDVPGPPVFSGYLRDITERKESESERLRLLEAEQKARAEAEEASKRLSQLQRITDAALSHLSVNELLEELLARITETLSSDTTAILLMREEGEDLTVRAARGVKSDITTLPPVPLGEQAAGIVAATREPLTIDSLSKSEIEAPVLHAEGMESLMAVPLMLENRALGVLLTASKEEAHYTADDLMLLQLAADRIAPGIQNASLFEREHQIATQLQQSLLPSRLPTFEAMEIAVRYVPGGSGLAVGGDWYDALSLPNGSVGVTIGDVVGKGIRAASVMGQLRNSLRVFALEGHAPDRVVGRINRLSDTFDRATMATLIYGIYEPTSGLFSLTNAGHPPPLVVTKSGARFLETTANIPLGVSEDEEFTMESFQLEQGDIVMMYTDGLIESPSASIDQGMEELRTAVVNGPQDLELLCNSVLDSVFKTRERSDDTAILMFRIL